MKRGRRVLLVLLACGVVAVGICLVWPREREPVYQGKRLSEWVRAYEMGYQNEAEKKVFVAEQEAAANAIRHLGTNALPCLLRWIAYEPPPWRERAGKVLWKLPVASLRRVLWKRDRLAWDATRADWGFRRIEKEVGDIIDALLMFEDGLFALKCEFPNAQAFAEGVGTRIAGIWFGALGFLFHVMRLSFLVCFRPAPTRHGLYERRGCQSRLSLSEVMQRRVGT